MRSFIQTRVRTKTWLGVLALMSFAPALKAQVSGYTFSQSNGTYAPITGGTVLGTATDPLVSATVQTTTLDDHTFTGVAIPFPFTFNGTAYNTLKVNTNGWVAFAGTLAATSSSAISSTVSLDAISSFGRDLAGVFATTGTRTNGSNTITAVANTANCYVGAPIQGTGIAAGTTVTAFTANTITMSANATATSTATYFSYATGEIRVETIGIAPARTFVIQYKGFSQYSAVGSAATTNNTGADFQIRLSEAGGVAALQKVEVVYGNVFRAAGTLAGEVGLKGSTSTDYNSRTSTTDWAATTASAAIGNTVSWTATVNPTSGLTYSWLPPSCVAPTANTITGITNSGATYSWNAPASAPSLGYDYYHATSSTAPTAATTPSGTATGTSTTVNTLSAATLYYVWVRSSCAVGTKSAWIPLGSFTTLCNTFPVPFTQDLNSGALPTCWATSNPSNNTDPNSRWKFSGTPDYGVAANGRTSGTYAWVDASSPYVDSVTFTSPSINLTGLTVPFISFDWFKNNTDPATTLLNNVLVVQVNSGSGWVNVFVNSTNVNGWRTESITLPASYVNTTVRVRFVVNKTSSNNFYDDVALDNIEVKEAPTCFTPTLLTSSAVSGTTATISWTAANPAPSNGYQYEVRTSGAPGSGATGLIVANSTAAGIVTANITGLSTTTAYSVYVRSNCGSSFSTWTTAHTFTTSLDCSNATPIVCGSPMIATIAAGTGAYANSACAFATPGIEKLYSFTPAVTGSYTLSVTAATGGYIDYMFRAASTGCGATGWTCIDDINSAVDNQITMTAGTTYLFMLDPENTTGVSQTFVMKCCLAPTALTATAITPTGASLGWTQAGSSSQWQVQWGTPTFTLGTGTNVFSGANPYVLGGLAASTSYSFYVRAICGVGDTSVWSSRFVFSTTCVNATLPFAENFTTAYPTSTCWTEATGALGASSTLTGTSSVWVNDSWLNGASSNNAARINIYNNTSAASRDWMITPTIDFGTGGTKVLEFNMGIVDYAAATPDTLGSDDTLAVVISTNNGATWSMANAVKIFTAANPPTGANGSQRYFIPLNGYSGLVKIGFYGSQGTIVDTKDNDVMIDSILITNCTLATVALGNDTAICPGKTLALASGTGTDYLWSTGATTQSIVTATAGTYWVKTTNGSAGCYTTDTVVVTTGVNPVVALGNDTTICPNATVTLNAGNAGSTYVWNNATTAQTLSATAAGTYFVTVKNAAACTASDTLVITNGMVPVVALGNDTVICAGASLTLDAGTGGSYLWSNSTTAQTISVNATGTYYVAVTSSTACRATDTIVVTVNPAATVNTITPAVTMPSVAFTSDAANATTYAWDFGDSGTDATASPTHVYTANGTYTVRLIVTNACGSDTTTTTVQITGVGVTTPLAANAIKLYPNPAINNVIVESANAIMSSYSLFNNVGALVKESRVMDAHKENIDLSALPSGMYQLRVTTNQGSQNYKVQIVK